MRALRAIWHGGSVIYNGFRFTGTSHFGDAGPPGEPVRKVPFQQIQPLAEYC